MLETAHSPLECIPPAHVPGDSESCELCVGLEHEKALQQVQAAGQAALPLGTYEPADPMVLAMSVADRDAVWSLWLAPIGE